MQRSTPSNFESLKFFKVWKFESLKVWMFEFFKVWKFESLKPCYGIHVFSNFQTFKLSNFQTFKVWTCVSKLKSCNCSKFESVLSSKVWKFESLKVEKMQFYIDNRASILGASTNYKIFIFPNEAEENHQVFLLLFTAAAIWCIHTRRPAAPRLAVVIDYTRLQLLQINVKNFVIIFGFKGKNKYFVIFHA